MKEPTHIQLGAGTRLVEESWYLNAFGGLLSKHGFKHLCRALGVPLLYIGSKRFVDQFRFQVAIGTITRLGNEDFYFPGCDPIKRSKAKKGRRHLTVEEAERSFRVVAAELILSRRSQSLSGREARNQIRVATDRMMSAALHTLPSKAQEREDKKNAREMKRW